VDHPVGIAVITGDTDQHAPGRGRNSMLKQFFYRSPLAGMARQRQQQTIIRFQHLRRTVGVRLQTGGAELGVAAGGAGKPQHRPVLSSQPALSCWQTKGTCPPNKQSAHGVSWRRCSIRRWPSGL
jgi:hypothetical protein